MPVVRDHSALISGTSIHAGTGKAAFYTYAFPVTVPAYYHGRFPEEALATFRPLSAAEQDAARAALQAWASVSGIALFEVSPGEGDIQFGVFGNGVVPEGNTAFAFYPPGLVDNAIASDIFLLPSVAADPYILLHEIGHALGLKHPHNGDPTLAEDLDHRGSTVMSYNAGGFPGDVLGPLDRSAIQYLYGGAAADGTQVASWSWDASTHSLTQIGFAGDDTILGVGSRDVISGNSGNDIIHGRAGSDRLDGGAGADRIFGSRGDDVLLGGTESDLLDGGEGSDILNGGGGNDTYVVDRQADQLVESAGGGTDTAQSMTSFTLPAHVENLTLAPLEPLSVGSGSIDATGNALANILIGNSLPNVLDGAAGADTMKGGGGNDIYIVDQAGDRAIEAIPNGGIDTVRSAASYTLGDYIDHLVLTGSGAIDGTGNGLANSITGNGAANVLNGGGGADTMKGGSGNDLYMVDQSGDRIVENSAGGLDAVTSSAAFTLGGHVENLTLTGTAAIAGTGNDLANALTGNGAANALSGLAGDDMLDGRGGGDTMRGGAGNDSYAVDSGGDRVIETSASHGSDSVRSSVSHTLGAHVENLTLTGAASLNGIGNALANRLTGNGGANTLNGGDGADRISGGGSSDSLSGGVGDDKLYGGTGNDSLTGGSGRNGFYFDTPLDARTNVDTITDFSAAYDTIFLDRDIFTGIAADGTLPASAFRAGAVARDADDRLLYDAATGRIFYDSDGSGPTAAILFAQVAPGTSLTSADFGAFI